MFDRGVSYEMDGRIYTDFADDYEHLDPAVEYAVESVLQTTDVESREYDVLRDQFNALYANFCVCAPRPEDVDDENLTTQHIDEEAEGGGSTDGATEILCISKKCNHGQNYVIHTNTDGTKELILNEKRLSLDLIFECTDLCRCATLCGNRLIQFGPRKNLIIADFSHAKKHLGLITTTPLPKGAFVCEYVGEILSTKEATKRQYENDAEQKMNYIMCLNEMAVMSTIRDQPTQTFVDASRIGNIGRYLNHSCDPNCEVISVRVEGAIPRICTIRIAYICNLFKMVSILIIHFMFYCR